MFVKSKDKSDYWRERKVNVVDHAERSISIVREKMKLSSGIEMITKSDNETFIVLRTDSF